MCCSIATSRFHLWKRCLAHSRPKVLNRSKNTRYNGITKKECILLLGGTETTLRKLVIIHEGFLGENSTERIQNIKNIQIAI